MSRCRRNREGTLSFVTVVTHGRWPMFTTDVERRCLRDAIRDVRADHPLSILGIVLLPDHLHAIWRLPQSGRRLHTEQ